MSRFIEATLFNWAALGTDAHAKNYSLLHDRVHGASLAPLYDVATALPYPDLNSRRAKLAMSFDGHYRGREIEPSPILGAVAAAGVDPEWTREPAVERRGKAGKSRHLREGRRSDEVTSETGAPPGT